MKKIFLLLLFLGCQFCFGADINWSIQSGAVASFVGGGSIGAINNIRDNDENTWHGWDTGLLPPLVGNNFTFSQTIDFGVSAPEINLVEIVSTSSVFQCAGLTSLIIELYYSGSWNTVYNIGGGAWAKRTNNQAGTWDDVTKIRVSGAGNTFSGDFHSWGWNNFELRAWGPLAPQGNYSYIY